MRQHWTAFWKSGQTDMDGKKLHSRSPLLTVRVEQGTNGTLVASVIHHKKTHVQV